MRNIIKENFGKEIRTVNYVNPGQNLSDKDLKIMFDHLLQVNDAKDKSIEHKLIERGMPIQEIRNMYESSIVGIIYFQNQAAGFLISPVLKADKKTIVHSGLTIISKNYGADFLGLLSLGLIRTIHSCLGSTYITNISSTPSILEAFAKFTHKAWPDPDANLVKAPRDYKSVFDTLVENYVKNYFPDPELLQCDMRRFVLSTQSKKMGFNTSMRDLSRPSQFKYLNFCFTWLDYDKEEDVVQVAKTNHYTGYKAKLIILFLKYFVFANKKPSSRKEKSNVVLIKNNSNSSKQQTAQQNEQPAEFVNQTKKAS